MSVKHWMRELRDIYPNDEMASDQVDVCEIETLVSIAVEYFEREYLCNATYLSRLCNVLCYDVMFENIEYREMLMKKFNRESSEYLQEDLEVFYRGEVKKISFAFLIDTAKDQLQS